MAFEKIHFQRAVAHSESQSAAAIVPRCLCGRFNILEDWHFGSRAYPSWRVARGKLCREKFAEEKGMRLPEAISCNGHRRHRTTRAR